MEGLLGLICNQFQGHASEKYKTVKVNKNMPKFASYIKSWTLLIFQYT